MHRNALAAKMLCDDGSEPRLAMRGTSMLPLLREPMVLQLGRFPDKPKIGDVLVFADKERLVAHRFVAKTKDGMIVLAGDASQDTYDVVGPERIVGRVKAVWSGPEEGAHRVDGPMYRLRGRLIAHRSALRVRILQTKPALEFVLSRANPRRRARPYLALFSAMAAIMQADAGALRRDVASVGPALLLVLATRHRCGPLLIDGLEALGVADAIPAGLANELRKARWSTAVRTRALRQQVDTIIGICAAAGAVPVLLKGAARLYTEERSSDRHDSDDIDILLPLDQIPAVTAALRAAGYREKPGTLHLYARVHHTTPLFPPSGGFSVEMHHALAPTADVRMRTDFESLADRVRFVEGPSGRVGLFDDFMSALHSAIHAREPTELRNLVVLAYQLRRLTASERAALYELANREGTEKNRIHAALHGASRLAGLPSLASHDGRRHFAWRLRRYDLPFALCIRSEAIEWFVGTSGRGILRVLHAFLPRESGKERVLPLPLRVPWYAVKLAIKPAIFAIAACYAALMPEAQAETALVGRDEQTTSDEIA